MAKHLILWWNIVSTSQLHFTWRCSPYFQISIFVEMSWSLPFKEDNPLVIRCPMCEWGVEAHRFSCDIIRYTGSSKLWILSHYSNWLIGTLDEYRDKKSSECCSLKSRFSIDAHWKIRAKTLEFFTWILTLAYYCSQTTLQLMQSKTEVPCLFSWILKI